MKKKAAKVKAEVSNREVVRIINSSMQEALNLPSNGLGAQVSRADTLFENLRWYTISNDRQLLSEIYCEIGVVQTIIDVPVEDAYRGGIEIKSKQLSEEQITELIACIDEHDDLVVAAQTDKWNRLFGGGGTIILTDQDPEEPLEIDNLHKEGYLEFKDADMWELFFTQQSSKGNMPDWNIDYFDYYGMKLHKSRVLLRKGIRPPSLIRPRLRGWGLSALESLVRAMNQYLKNSDVSFEVMDEFKVDVFKIKNFTTTLMTQQGKNQILERVQLANMEKNFHNAITMDKEDDYEQKQVSFSGLAETMQQIRIGLAADLRMPMTKLFGISSAGFNSGEDDIENYNAMIESSIRSKAKMNILSQVKLRCQWKFGFVPDDLSISFKPLRILSAEQEETVKTQKFNRVQAARTSGDITIKEYRDSINRDALLPIQLDVENIDELEDDNNSLEADEDTDQQQDAAKGEKETKSKLIAKTAKDAKS